MYVHSSIVSSDYGRSVEPKSPQFILQEQISRCEGDIAELDHNVDAWRRKIAAAEAEKAALHETAEKARAAIALLDGIGGAVAEPPLEDWGIPKGSP